MITLKGITWNHTRGFTPMVATAQRFEELNPDVQIIWEKRSLQAFADEPIDLLAKQYDLLVIDHPWAGFAAKTGVIEALDNLLPREFLEDQADNAVGFSHESYRYNNKQWALAMDAATPVAAARMDLLQQQNMAMPQTWDELMELAKKGKVAVPSISQDTLMNFYMLCCTMGEPPCESDEFVVSQALGINALESLRELSIHLDRRCFDWNPIKVYEAMTQGDDFAYCPFAYGYSNYAKPNYARKLLKFSDTVDFNGQGRLITTIGGTGFAISANCQHKEVAAQYAEFTANPAMQAGFFTEFGGQPGHRLAWESPSANAVSDNYFTDTLPTLERAYLRPRYAGHMYFQDNAGAPIRDYLMNGGDAKALLARLNDLYLTSKEVTL
jgi:multiple sugar transport system substrate-binding protein